MEINLSSDHQQRIQEVSDMRGFDTPEDYVVWLIANDVATMDHARHQAEFAANYNRIGAGE